MSKWKISTLIALFAFLIIGPLLFDAYMMRGDRLRYRRHDDLQRRYDCDPVERCVADFNGDGIPARFEVRLTAAVDGDLIIIDGGREILRLPFDHTDGTLRTHIAVVDSSGKSRLLVYDGVTHRPPLRATFAWDGENLAGVSPAAIEREIISAMEAYDDTGGWNDRALKETLREAWLVPYYIGLTIFIGVTLYQKWRNPVRKLP